MENIVEDQMTVISQLYPDLYNNQVQPHQGGASSKPARRRRKKSKSSEGGELKKRKLSDEQVNMLEASFGYEHKLESERKDRLASELGLEPKQVAVWFQNRRARWKNKKLEEEYSRLRAQHDSVVLEKCRLETEVLNMKEKLNDAQKTIQNLSERGIDNISSNSPVSSMTMDAMDTPLFGGGFGPESFDNIFSALDNRVLPDMEWVNYNVY